MPTSDPRQIAPIIRELQRLDPRHVLDAGAGYGKYGVLMREYLDDWDGRLELVAVEPWPDYTERSTAFAAYDVVHHSDLATFLQRAEQNRYDVGLLVDVLEHFDAGEGRAVLRNLCHVCRHVVVATPREPSDQGHPPPYGNVFETHRSRWSEAAIAAVAPVARFVPVEGDEQLVVTLGPS